MQETISPPSWQTDQRLMVFLIADLRGYTAFTHQRGDQAGAQLTARFIDLARQAVSAFQGSVLEVRGDEVLAVFSSARGALRAAAALQALCAARATDDLPLRAGIGLEVGEPVPLQGGYRGEALNVAARLCALAGPGEILASESLLHLARQVEGLVYRERDPVDIKGLDQPMRISEVHAAPGVEPPAAWGMHELPTVLETSTPPEMILPLPEGPLVGREAEMGRLLASLDSAEGSHGRLVLLAGEPGVGKTRLARELIAHAACRGWRVLVGRCDEQQNTLPYFPFVDVLAAGVASAPATPRSELAGRLPELAQLVPALHGYTLPPVAGEDSRLRIAQAVTAFLAALAADAPLLLVIDDLQWADSASLELLQHLARRLRTARVLLLGTYRDVEVGRRHPLEAALSHLWRERLVTEITLRGLSAAGTSALIAARTGVETVPADFAALIQDRTEGNPFFTEEVLTELAEEGAVNGDTKAWEHIPVAEIEVPHSVRSVVGQRVGRLPSEAQELLHTASVLGREFDLDLLLGAGDQPEPAALDGLDAALAARLLEERCSRTESARGEHYAFTHTLIQQTLYQEIPAHRLRRRHLHAGEVLERARGERPESWAVLVHHFLAAGESARAIPYALLAGDHAAGLCAPAEAAGHYRTALDLLIDEGDEARAAEVRRKLGGALHDLGHGEEALRAYAAALEAFERLGDAVGQARVHRDMAWVHQWRYDLRAAVPHLEAALALWPVEREDADLARLLLDTSRAQVFAGDAATAGGPAERGLAVAERLGDPALEGRALVETALVQVATGASPQTATALLDKAESLARRACDWLTLFRIYYNRADRHMASGDPAGAQADYQRALEVTERTCLPAQGAAVLIARAMLYCEQGDWIAARACALQARSLDERTWARQGGVILAVLEGDDEQAIGIAGKMVAEARLRNDLWMVAEGLLWMADRALLRGKLEEAEQLAREARRVPHLAAKEEITAELAEVLVRRGCPDAEDVLATAEALVEEKKHLGLVPRLLRTRAWLVRGQGDLDASLAALQGSADAARRQGAMLELGRTLADLTDVARIQGNATLAAAADSERAAIVEHVGPEIGRLGWLWTRTQL